MHPNFKGLTHKSNFMIQAELDDELRRLAYERRVSAAQIIREAVEDYLKRLESGELSWEDSRGADKRLVDLIRAERVLRNNDDTWWPRDHKQNEKPFVALVTYRSGRLGHPLVENKYFWATGTVTAIREVYSKSHFRNKAGKPPWFMQSLWRFNITPLGQVTAVECVKDSIVVDPVVSRKYKGHSTNRDEGTMWDPYSYFYPVSEFSQNMGQLMATLRRRYSNQEISEAEFVRIQKDIKEMESLDDLALVEAVYDTILKPRKRGRKPKSAVGCPD